MDRRQFLRILSAASTAGLLGASETLTRPNILLIYADDVGYGDLSCYGARSVQTPNIDSLAADGLRFTNAHADAATCTPSRYALMTGQYAWRKPGTGILPGDASLIIGPHQLTLPAMLKRHGYRTGVVGKWHLGLGRGTIDWNTRIAPGPLEVGFDSSFIIPATLDRVPCVFVDGHQVVHSDPNDPIHVSYKQPFPNEATGQNHPEMLRLKPSYGHNDAIVNGVPRIGFMEGGKSALWNDENIVDVLAAKAADFVGQKNGQPFFLYYAVHDIHVPRLPNPRFQGATTMGTRGDAIAELDWSVGHILEELKAKGLTENTLVIFSSDNGPVVDDGYQDLAAQKLGSHKPAGRYRGGKYSNFDGGTRIPFIVRWPSHIRPGTTSNALISQVDLFASFAALTHQLLSHDDAPDSLNMLPAVLGRSPNGRTSLVEEAGVLSLIDGDWKVIRASDKPRMDIPTNTELGNAPQPQLYNIAEDPSEKIDVAAQHPERVRTMLAELANIQARDRTR